jgi:predicted TPR repeat methyltransferase
MSTPDFERARAHFVAGNAAFEAGRFEQAEAEFQASLQALPGRPSTLVNLAATRLRLGRPADALAPLETALAAQPDDGEAWHHRAVALGELGRHEQAVQAFDRALAAGTENAAVHYRRGLALAALERQAEAAQAWERALAFDDQFVPAWVDLGSLLRDLGQHERALPCLERALALGADDPMLRFQVAALRDAQQAPEAPPREYVQRLFDGYAEGFDAHLVGTLGYRTPQLLAEGLATTGVPHFATALDLGCGTGLLAAPLDRWVDRLDGMDLSAAMLEKARALGRYERLEQGDMAEHLARTERRYALVVAADVFVYLGALEPVFAGVMRVLEPGGVFAFSVEAADGEGEEPADAAPGTGPGYVLRSTLRYAHTERYLRTLAQAHGLQVCATRRHALRQDHGATIVGLCAWMRRLEGAPRLDQVASQAAV